MSDSPIFKENQIALVVGGSQGIGLGLVENILKGEDATFLDKRCYVVTTVRTLENPALQQLQSQYPGRLFLEELEVTDEASVEKFAIIMKDKYKRLDFYIHNAGAIPEVPSHPTNPKISSEIYILTHKINAIAPQHVFCALLPLLNSTHEMLGGKCDQLKPQPICAETPDVDDATKVRCVFIASSMGSVSELHTYNPLPIYASSKAAMYMLCRNLALQFPYLSIQVIHPGHVITRLAPNGLITIDQSSRGVLSTISKRGFATTSMDKLLTWDDSTLGW